MSGTTQIKRAPKLTVTRLLSFFVLVATALRNTVVLPCRELVGRWIVARGLERRRG